MRQSVLLFLLVLMVGCAAKLPVSLERASAQSSAIVHAYESYNDAGRFEFWGDESEALVFKPVRAVSAQHVVGDLYHVMNAYCASKGGELAVHARRPKLREGLYPFDVCNINGRPVFAFYNYSVPGGAGQFLRIVVEKAPQASREDFERYLNAHGYRNPYSL